MVLDAVGGLFVLGFFGAFLYMGCLVLALLTLHNRYHLSLDHELRSRFSELPAGPIVFGVRRIYVARPKLVALHLGEHDCTVFFEDGTKQTLAGLNTGRWRLWSRVKHEQDSPRCLQLQYSLRNHWMKFGIDLLPASEPVLPPWASSEQILLLEGGVFRSRAVS